MSDIVCSRRRFVVCAGWACFAYPLMTSKVVRISLRTLLSTKLNPCDLLSLYINFRNLLTYSAILNKTLTTLGYRCACVSPSFPPAIWTVS